MDSNSIMHKIIQGLTSRGADLASCHLNHHKKDELSLEAGSIKLLRTTHETSLSISAILDHKKGSIVINKLNNEALDAGMDQVIEIAQASRPDPANNISNYQEPMNFSHGSENPDMDMMYSRLEEFNDTVKTRYPYTILEEAGIDFTRKEHLYLNSNDTFFSSDTGFYSFGAMFTSKIKEKSSSFNYTDMALDRIQKPLIIP